MEFLLCADLIPAQRAYEMGLLNAVVPRDQLLETAYEFARRMTANAPLAVQATKQSALQGLYHDEDTTRALREAVNALAGVLEQVVSADADGDAGAAAVRSAIEVLQGLGKQLRTPFEKESRISSRIFQTEDAKEGPKAFAEKRKPNWQAR
jgi:enoyl-CoA hydratase